MDDIIVRTKDEAKEVLSKLGAILDRYAMVTVADFKDLVGLETFYADQNVGWFSLHQFRMDATAEGVRLSFPAPEKRREVTRQQMVEKAADALVASTLGRALKLRDVEARTIAEVVFRSVEN